MQIIQIFAIVVSLAIAAVGTTLFVRAIRDMIAVLKVGQPAMNRTDDPASRTVTLLKESLGHTRMLKWTWVGAGHWFIFVGFGLLFFTLVTAFGQLFDASFQLPLIGHFFLWEWVTELFTWVMVFAIIAFIRYRLTRPKERVRGVPGRFFGSTMWQAYFVESVILGVGLCIIFLRGFEFTLASADGESYASSFHYPLTSWLGHLFGTMGIGADGASVGIYLVSMIKILISFTWMIVISLNLTMGIAWHRFTAFFNIWFKRESSGRTALGALKPLTSAGQAIDLSDIEELDEDAALGVGSIEDFSWKNLLDFTSCTECGRCQSQCPAWNTDKPLSPKLLITALRDSAYKKAPYLQAPESERAALLEGNATLTLEVERPLIGDTGDDWFYNPESGAAVIDPEVLWNCTSCGACVEQCPVDIEHVDHIIDMRRYAVLVESNFPAELNGLFKGMENKGNPWNMSPSARLDWAKGLDFEVKVVGEDIESLDEVDWLFWVGCAGAYEDRAKKTTRAVAELLDMAGVSFGVLGNGETCTGDPARRAGNEFVFQGLAQQNAEVFKETKVKKVVSTCAHCFNTLKNEYKEFGVELEVVHHTQLLNRLVREGKLTPVKDGAGAHQRKITYHDPCYIGRHNGVYTPPRELLAILPGAQVVEMERNSERAFCCGAGGARMWMEENTGQRINVNRTNEAIGTGADQIAVGCPFCRVMLSDGLTAAQDKGDAREEVEVLDVAQMLLASVKGEMATKVAPGGAATEKVAAAPAAKERAVETKAEPEEGDVTNASDPENTVVATEDAGPLAEASGGTSLFDTPEAKTQGKTADEDTSVLDEAKAAEPKSAGGSLFDLESGDSAGSEAGGGVESARSDTPESASTPEAETVPTQVKDTQQAEGELASGGSLFDVMPVEPTAKKASGSASAPGSTTAAAPAAKVTDKQEDGGQAAKPADVKDAQEPEADLGSSGSLFDIKADEPTAAPAAEPRPEAAAQKTVEPIESAQNDTAEPASKSPSAESASTQQQPGQEEAAVTTPSEETSGSAASRSAAPATAVTPSTEIPEGGSLFDITAPEPTVASKKPAAPQPDSSSEPARRAESGSAVEAEPETASTPSQAESKPAAETVADSEPAAGSAADSEPAPAAEAEPAADPSSQAESAPVAQDRPVPVPAPDAAESEVAQTKTSGTAGARSSSRSLFDVASPGGVRPERSTGPAAGATAAKESAESTSSTSDQQSSSRSLFDVAAPETPTTLRPESATTNTTTQSAREPENGTGSDSETSATGTSPARAGAAQASSTPSTADESTAAESGVSKTESATGTQNMNGQPGLSAGAAVSQAATFASSDGSTGSTASADSADSAASQRVDAETAATEQTSQESAPEAEAEAEADAVEQAKTTSEPSEIEAEQHAGKTIPDAAQSAGAQSDGAQSGAAQSHDSAATPDTADSDSTGANGTHADSAEQPVAGSEKPKAAGNGASHTPKTDVDISGSSSLFDF